MNYKILIPTIFFAGCIHQPIEAQYDDHEVNLLDSLDEDDLVGLPESGEDNETEERDDEND
jgi:hypothetical protein|tara:strand:+ start:573 stop:755 length:183 start_codon:yes stop_codon:yes gene_type:complete